MLLYPLFFFGGGRGIRKDLAKTHKEPSRLPFHNNIGANTEATHSMVCVVNYIWRRAECCLPKSMGRCFGTTMLKLPQPLPRTAHPALSML